MKWSVYEVYETNEVPDIEALCNQWSGQANDEAKVMKPVNNEAIQIMKNPSTSYQMETWQYMISCCG